MKLTHLKPGTTVYLTRELTENEHACPGLLLPNGCEGVLVDEEGDVAFRPIASGFENWCCYLAPEDYRQERFALTKGN